MTRPLQKLVIGLRLRQRVYNRQHLSHDEVRRYPLHRGEPEMTARDKLIQAIETLPDYQVERVLAYIQIMADPRPTQEQNSQEMPCFDETWWNNLSQFSPDFLEVREQPQLPAREDMFE
jgi:hypothetical protein